MRIKLDAYKANITPEEREKISLDREQEVIIEIKECVLTSKSIDENQITFVNQPGGVFCVNIPSREKLHELDDVLFETSQVDLTEYYYTLFNEEERNKKWQKKMQKSQHRAER